MKTAQTPQTAPEAPVRVEFQVQFSGGRRGRGRGTSAKTSAPEPVEETSLNRLPKITRLLVLAYHFEALIRDGVVKDYAEIARLTGLSRARVTQLANLGLLSSPVQEAILGAPGSLAGVNRIVERDLRSLTTDAAWSAQRKGWAALMRRS